jgi:hydrogenase maturation protease
MTMSSQQQHARLLIAGVGNIFLGDDAFGVEVVQRLLRRPLPDGVRVVDFGIRGLDLAYALLDGYQAVILVDSVPRGGQPGTLYVVEPELEPALPLAEGGSLLEAHNMDPARVLRLVAALGGKIERLVIVGCEPETTIGGEEEDLPGRMSAAVQAAVDEAVLLVEALVGQLLHAPYPAVAEAAARCEENTIPGKEVRICHPQDKTG